jgi:hypothetical protein
MEVNTQKPAGVTGRSRGKEWNSAEELWLFVRRTTHVRRNGYLERLEEQGHRAVMHTAPAGHCGFIS